MSSSFALRNLSFLLVAFIGKAKWSKLVSLRIVRTPQSICHDVTLRLSHRVPALALPESALLRAVVTLDALLTNIYQINT